jgi:tetratricopeptide (TPR) repeat protein
MLKITFNHHTRSRAMKKAAMLLVLFAAVAAMAQTPKQSVAVYMAGTEPADVKGAQKVLGAELAKALAKSGKYTAVDRTDEVIKVLSAADIFRQDGAIDVDKAKTAGKQLGAQVVCVAEISEVMNNHFLEAKLVNVETAEMSNIATAHGNMKNSKDVVRTAQLVANELVGGKVKIVNYSFREIAANDDVDKTIEDYTEAIRQASNETEYYYKRGYSYYLQKENDKALADFSAAIMINSANYKEAINQADFSEATRLDSNSSEFHKKIGDTYMAKGNFNNAVNAYAIGLDRDPNDAVAYARMGYAMDSWVEALLYFDDALRLDPKNMELYLVRAFIRGMAARGGSLSKANESLGQMMADYSKVIKSKSKLEYRYDNTFYRAMTQDVLIDSYRCAEGCEYVMTAEQLLPKDLAGIYYNMGVFYLMANDDGKTKKNKAIKYFNMAIKLNPDYAVEGYKGISRAYLSLAKVSSIFGVQDYGKLDKAIESFKKVLQIDPNDCYVLPKFQEYSRLARRK